MIIEEIPIHVSGKRAGKPIGNAIISLQCDDCKIKFTRSVSASIKNHETCKGCSIARNNRKRDPAIHQKMIQNAAKTWKGKTREEVCGKEKAYKAFQAQSKANSGKNNPNYGGKYSRGFADNPLIGKWEDVFGKEEADRRKAALVKRISGSGNPMYGKPSPKKSGNGISGWWKNKLYFRSLLELAFILKCERENIVIESAERKQYRFEYELNGVNRTYTPDFVDKNGNLYECKPTSLVKSVAVQSKLKVAPHVKIITEKEVTRPTYSELKFLIQQKHVIIDQSKLLRIEKWA